MSTIRTFICIDLSSEMRGKLGGMIAQLSRATPQRSVRWDKADKIHLTLKFLGDTPQEDVPRISEALINATRDIKKFSFTLDGLGCFPNFKQPRVVWVGVKDSAALIEMQNRIETQTVPLGFPKEDRAFSPHLTLGRVRREASRAEAASVGEAVRIRANQTFGIESVSRVILMKSDLQRGGSIYTSLFTTPLC
ncbi:RNA 2',3'-cyclic phosphodiesterase [Candidatus Woesearchaeota archaeon]|nr:RNA 2',3'-cyclic phosphodiesterase [Candidatus Woesearchaeota archaeon]